jgi:hypothetical protein
MNKSQDKLIPVSFGPSVGVLAHLFEVFDPFLVHLVGLVFPVFYQMGLLIKLDRTRCQLPVLMAL